MQLDRVLIQALDPVPADRFATARDFAEALAASGEAREARVAPLPRGRRRAMTTVAALLLVAAVAVVWSLPWEKPERERQRVVVAVFDNLTGDESLDELGILAQYEILRDLDRTGLFQVTSILNALSSYRYAQMEAKASPGLDPHRLLAREKAAAVVVSGAYERHGDSIRFTPQLTDAEGVLLGAIDPVAAPLAVPEEAVELLGQRVTGLLARRRSPRYRRMSAVGTRAPAYGAFQEFVRGMDAMLRLDFVGSIGNFSEALARDTTFVMAQFYIASSYTQLGAWAKADSVSRLVSLSDERLTPYERVYMEWMRAHIAGDQEAALRAARQANGISQSDWWPLSMSALRNNRPREALDALAHLDPQGDLMRGFFLYYWVLTGAHHMMGDHEQELEAARSGCRQYPDQLATLALETKALAALGRVEQVNGRLEEGLHLRAMMLTPGQVMLAVAIELRAHGYPEGARQVLERAIQWFKARPPAEAATLGHRFVLAGTYYQAERWEEARTLFEDLDAEHPGNVNFVGHLGVLAARRGDREAALRLDERLQQLTRPYFFGRHAYWRARIASLLGDADRAVNLLQEAYYDRGRSFFGESRSPDDPIMPVMYAFLHAEMDFEALREHAGFQELMRPKG
jgi:tetratricopeptide (TPR) repeat protein